jgi:hypothetical protein
MRFIRKHLEWMVFGIGILLLGLMSPENTGTSFCFFEWIGIGFCPGEGLGHSISYTFRGNFTAAIQAHFAGPFAVAILGSRVIYIWRKLYQDSKLTIKKDTHG